MKNDVKNVYESKVIGGSKPNFSAMLREILFKEGVSPEAFEQKIRLKYTAEYGHLSARTVEETIASFHRRMENMTLITYMTAIEILGGRFELDVRAIFVHPGAGPVYPEVWDQSIDDLELPHRIKMVLVDNDVAYIGELVSKTEADILRMVNMGRGSLTTLRSAMHRAGLQLGTDTGDWKIPAGKPY